jgi:disulfide bond formation protein DsbB
VTITAAPATLTDAGAAAFGTYPAGEELDPITIAFSTAADCAVATEEEPMTTATAEPEADTETAPVAATTDLGWILWVVIALLAIAVIVLVVVLVRRKK